MFEQARKLLPWQLKVEGEIQDLACQAKEAPSFWRLRMAVFLLSSIHLMGLEELVQRPLKELQTVLDKVDRGEFQ